MLKLLFPSINEALASARTDAVSPRMTSRRAMKEDGALAAQHINAG